MKDIIISLQDKEFHKGDTIRGTVDVSYPGRYDGVVINAQILGANELVEYTSYNGRKISQKTRLFVAKESMPEDRIEFTATVDFEPEQKHEIKFRASIIEQHKEIDSHIVFAEYS